MPIEQIIVLAVVQGITEFLPISSSGHLILVPYLTGWPDQGLAIDIMVHLGSLCAILVYFWRDVARLTKGAVLLLAMRVTDDGRLAMMIAAATVPAIAMGLLLRATGFLDQIRGIEIIAWNAIIFSLLMAAADLFGRRIAVISDMRFAPAMLIGFAQALALIPGTSRSGITMTAARALGFQRVDAARFSFLLGIPAIAGAGLLTIFEVERAGAAIPGDAWLAAGLTFISSLAAIAFLMALVPRLGLVPFVVYRLILGAVLLFIAYG